MNFASSLHRQACIDSGGAGAGANVAQASSCAGSVAHGATADSCPAAAVSAHAREHDEEGREVAAAAFAAAAAAGASALPSQGAAAAPPFPLCATALAHGFHPATALAERCFEDPFLTARD